MVVTLVQGRFGVTGVCSTRRELEVSRAVEQEVKLGSTLRGLSFILQAVGQHWRLEVKDHHV